MLSIHPRWVELILSGKKTIELRRRGINPRHIGAEVIIYETSPTSAFVATCRITEILQAPLKELWTLAGKASAVPEDLFHRYFADLQSGFGLRLEAARRLPEPVLLEAMRKRAKWHPPVSWCTISRDDLKRLMAGSD
ncbi:ASCH domain-containing protein [Microvirga terrae]|uniref:ASCH domain-containing protein n=1 Tax=Microvirga terrae TaxID=2740529 RepID=UPI003D813693